MPAHSRVRCLAIQVREVDTSIQSHSRIAITLAGGCVDPYGGDRDFQAWKHVVCPEQSDCIADFAEAIKQNACRTICF